MGFEERRETSRQTRDYKETANDKHTKHTNSELLLIACELLLNVMSFVKYFKHDVRKEINTILQGDSIF